MVIDMGGNFKPIENTGTIVELDTLADLVKLQFSEYDI